VTGLGKISPALTATRAPAIHGAETEVSRTGRFIRAHVEQVIRRLRVPRAGAGSTPNSDVARLCGKKPLTRLATLATLSPRERAELNHR
jgi:hypothetical protein